LAKVFISQLRKKVEDDPAHPTYILTESHIGYRFREAFRQLRSKTDHADGTKTRTEENPFHPGRIPT
jgi:DNA-binding winged helix-turn-helix (wHTH) protein